MEDKYDWYSKDIFIAKEEVIALRTLYLEFGNESTKKARLELPYENIEISDGSGDFEGYHAIDLYDMLLFYFQINDEFPKPLDLEFLECIHFIITNNGTWVGIPWQRAVFNFVEDIKPNKLKSELNFRFKRNLIWLYESAKEFSISPDPRVKEYLERPDDIIYEESLEDYKKLSNNKLFNNLRIGLWYKKFGEYEKALKFLEKARIYCRAELVLFNLRNRDYIGEFNKKIKQYEKDIGIDDVMNVSLSPDEYYDWWESKTKIIKVSIELQLSAEENPSFQIGEIYLKQGEEDYKEKRYQEAKNNYLKANYYFQEVENYLYLWCREKRYLKYNLKTTEDEYNVIKTVICKERKEWVALNKNDIDMLLFLTLEIPVYLPLSIKPFQRNSYLEGSLQICKSRLELIKSKKISKEDSFKDQKAKDLENMEDKKLIKNNKKRFESFIKRYQEIAPINDDIKKINKKNIEDDCQKKFPIIFPKLFLKSKNEMIRDRMYERITNSKEIYDYLPSIGCLSRMFEKESEITITELIKKYKLNFHFKSTDYKIGKLKNLLEEFGQERLKIDKKELDAVINELNQVSDFRAPSAHPTSGGTHDDLLEFRRLLFGRDKEEDGLLYKIIKYRSI
jgi:hypothetical protein